MAVLVIADHDNTTVRDTTNKTIAAAGKLSSDIDVLVLGENAQAAADAAAKIAGVRKVLLAESPSLHRLIAEAVADVVVPLASGYEAILTPSTSAGKNFSPRIAAKLDVMQISDVIEIVDANTFVRPIYAGNALETVQSSDTPKVITVRPTVYKAVASEGGSGSVERLNANADVAGAKFVSDEVVKSERPDLGAAKIVVSGGRALGSSEEFHRVIDPLADILGAAVGASRAAVDAGYAPNDYQVGQTGKVVAPDLYIAIGISGAIQHLAGMKDSKVIVAINKDSDAPIFQVADYGLVADYKTAIPELMTELGKTGGELS
jgi:electron transfer flavoprotein alpha subunit